MLKLILGAFLLSLSLGATQKRYKPVGELTIDLLEDDGEDIPIRECITLRNSLVTVLSYVVVLMVLGWLVTTGYVNSDLQLYVINSPLFTFLLVGSLFCCYTDTKYAVISNFFTYGGTLLGILTSLIIIFTNTLVSGTISIGVLNLGTGFTCLVMCGILQLLARRKIGGGDLKFMVMTSFVLPITVMSYFLLLACIIMLGAFVVRAFKEYLKTKIWNFKQPLQFGVPLTISLWVHLIGYIYFIHH